MIFMTRKSGPALFFAENLLSPAIIYLSLIEHFCLFCVVSFSAFFVSFVLRQRGRGGGLGVVCMEGVFAFHHYRDKASRKGEPNTTARLKTIQGLARFR